MYIPLGRREGDGASEYSNSCAANGDEFIPIRYICIPTDSSHQRSLPPLTLSMEHPHPRENDSNPNPTDNPAEPLIQADPSLSTQNSEVWPSPPHSTTNSQYADDSRFSSLQSLRPKLANLGFALPRSKQLFRGFERPSFSRIAILTVLCLIIYPAFYILTLVAKDKSLFIVRLIVAMWCSGIGFALGYILLKIGAQHLEAASEFTLVWYLDFLRLYFEQPGPP